MAIIEILLGLVGGLGLFLFGMTLMSHAIKAIAGSRLKRLLTALTRQRIVAVALGAIATMLVQSSSATTVMTVGFVNAGLLSVRRSLCVVLGANVGTTITAWVVSIFGFGGFKITAYALPIVGIGFFMQMLCRSLKFKDPALKEIRQLESLLMEMFERVLDALKGGNPADASQAMDVEKQLNRMQVSLRKKYARRIGSKRCSPEVGFVLIDFVDNAEKIGDHLASIAQSVMVGLQWDHHEDLRLTGMV